MRLPNHHFDTKVMQTLLLCLFFAVQLRSHAKLSSASALTQTYYDPDTNALDTQKHVGGEKKEKKSNFTRSSSLFTL